jgi:hypothetical protein
VTTVNPPFPDSRPLRQNPVTEERLSITCSKPQSRAEVTLRRWGERPITALRSQVLPIAVAPALFSWKTLVKTEIHATPSPRPQALHLAIQVAALQAEDFSRAADIAITNRPSGNLLYAADLANNVVDVHDANFNLVNSFTDPTLPPGDAPFGVQDIGGLVYVAFTLVSEAPGGYIDTFQEDGRSCGNSRPAHH